MSLRNTNKYEFVSSGQVAASSSFSFSGGVDVHQFTEAVILVEVSNDSGSSPTLTVKVQTLDPHSTNEWYDLSTLVTDLDVSGADSTTIRNAYTVTNMGEKIRIGYKVGGSGTTATFQIRMVAKT